MPARPCPNPTARSEVAISARMTHTEFGDRVTRSQSLLDDLADFEVPDSDHYRPGKALRDFVGLCTGCEAWSVEYDWYVTSHLDAAAALYLGHLSASPPCGLLAGLR